MTSTTSAPPTPSVNVADVIAVLAGHGYRMTAPRRAVLAAVLGRARPFTAEQVVAEVKRGEPNVGRATVYRTLEILASVDVLTRFLQADGHPAYIVGAPGHRHHLVCSACGAVVAFTHCPVDELVRDLTRDTDFAIHGHLLEVFGVCPECREGEADGAGVTRGNGSAGAARVGDAARGAVPASPRPPGAQSPRAT
jgi:Fur family ferric uptake transcriptional regulator